MKISLRNWFLTLKIRKSSIRSSYFVKEETLETVIQEAVVVETVEVETNDMENKSVGFLVSL